MSDRAEQKARIGEAALDITRHAGELLHEIEDGAGCPRAVYVEAKAAVLQVLATVNLGTVAALIADNLADIDEQLDAIALLIENDLPELAEHAGRIAGNLGRS